MKTRFYCNKQNRLFLKYGFAKMGYHVISLMRASIPLFSLVWTIGRIFLGH